MSRDLLVQMVYWSITMIKLLTIRNSKFQEGNKEVFCNLKKCNHLHVFYHTHHKSFIIPLKGNNCTIEIPDREFRP